MTTRAGDCPPPPSQAIVFAGGSFTVTDLDACDASVRDAFCVCVDSGLVHCQAAGLQPDLLVGDMDSVPPAALAEATSIGVPRLMYSSEKNASDLELALLALSGERAAKPFASERVTGVPGHTGSDANNPVDSATVHPSDRHGEDADSADADRLALQAAFGESGIPDEVIVVGVSGGRTDHLLFNWLLAGQRVWPFALRLIDATSDATLVRDGQPLAGVEAAGRTISLVPLGRVTGVTTGGLRYPLGDATLDVGTTRGLSNVALGGDLSISVRDGSLLVMRVRRQEQQHDRCTQ